ncbi:MAG: tetratricopeptide repeat protein [Pseudomonadales bacterium]
MALQVVSTVADPMGLPEWSMRVLIIVAIVGFPVSFLLAWVIDLRPEGLIFDLPLLGGNLDQPRQRKKSDLPFATLLLLIVAGGSSYLIVRLVDETGGTAELAMVQTAAPLQTAAPHNSIAVLAFENYDGNADTNYFALGLGEEILLLLSGLGELQVAARSSSFQFRGKQIGVRQVAKRLQVKHVLEGSARQNAGTIRIGAQLINGITERNNWTGAYERSVDDIFTVQKEIANSVVDQLKIVLSVESKKELQLQPTKSTDAYLKYLQGAGRLRSSLDADVMKEAGSFFRQAIAIDPQFSRAYAGICEAHLRLYNIGNDVTDFEFAETACERASTLNAGLNSESSLALGKLYMSRGWHKRAEKRLKKAIALSEDPIDAYIQLAELRATQGREEEAESDLRKAISMKAGYWAAHEALARFYFNHRRYREAVAEYEKTNLLAPMVATAYGSKGAAFWMLGEYNQAIEAYEESLDIKPSRLAHTNVGSLHFYAGRFDKAIENQQKALEFAPDDHRVLGRLAEAYYFAGRKEESLSAYRRAASQAEKNMEVNQTDWKTQGNLGLYYAQLGRFEEALIASKSALVKSDGNHEMYYFLGLVQLLQGDQQAALNALGNAIVANEQYRERLASDPYLEELWPTPAFKHMLESGKPAN